MRIIGFLRVNTVSNRRMSERQVLRLFKAMACAVAENLTRIEAEAGSLAATYAAVAAALGCALTLMVIACAHCCKWAANLPMCPKAAGIRQPGASGSQQGKGKNTQM